NGQDMEQQVNAKGLPDMEAGKGIFGLQIHGDGYEAAYNGNVSHNSRGLSGVGFTHGWSIGCCYRFHILFLSVPHPRTYWFWRWKRYSPVQRCRLGPDRTRSGLPWHLL